MMSRKIGPIRVDDDTLSAIMRAAELDGKDTHAWIRDVCRDRAQRRLTMSEVLRSRNERPERRARTINDPSES